MILLIGDRGHAVLEGLQAVLESMGQPWTLFDTSTATARDIRAPAGDGRQPWRLVGAGCEGRRAVSAVFIRRGGSLPVGQTKSAPRLWSKIDRLLLSLRCPVMNRPADGAGNYSKVHQLLMLAAAGLTVPDTLVTGVPSTAMQFIVDHQGRVLTKGICNIKTMPQVIGPEHLARIGHLRRCPVQLQPVIDGQDVRLTVVGSRALASVGLPAGGYRTVDGFDELPAQTVQRCIDFVASQGLLLGGFDLRVTRQASYCLELNATPLLSHYDMKQDPQLARAVVECLLALGRPTQELLA